MDKFRFSTKMATNRRQLNFFLASQGQPAGYYPACGLCGGKGPEDAHEVWIAKADVQGNEELRQKVMTEPMNTVILHHSPCHIPMAESQRSRFQMMLVDIYGAEKIIAWIMSLGLKEPLPYVNMVLAVPALVKKETV